MRRHERVDHRSALRTGWHPRAAACSERNRKASTSTLPGSRRTVCCTTAMPGTTSPGRRWPGRAARCVRLEPDGAAMLVHASFAFVHAVEHGASLEGAVALVGRCDPRMRSAGAVGSGARVCRAPRLSVRPGERVICERIAPLFVLGDRTGPVRRKALQYHLHQFDAVSALLAAARPRNAGQDPLRHRRSRDFVHAADGCVRASGWPANPAASAVVLEAPWPR